MPFGGRGPLANPALPVASGSLWHRHPIYGWQATGSGLTYDGSTLSVGTLSATTFSASSTTFSTLDVASSKFTVDSNGNITKLRNVTVSFPSSNASGFLKNDGSGTLTWAAATATAWSDITDPTATASLAMGLRTTTMSWNTATTQTCWTMATGSLSSGTLMDISCGSTAATGNTQTVFKCASSGANASGSQTTYAAQLSNTHTGTSSTNIALKLTASGGSTANYAIQVSAGVVQISDSTAATSTTTGAVTVSGGVGIAGDLYVGASINQTAASTNSFLAVNTSASSSSQGALIRAASNDGAAMASGDRLGVFALSGARDASSTINNSIGIAGYATEAWSGTACGAKLVFQTVPNGTTGRVDRVTIDQDGTTIFDGGVRFNSGNTAGAGTALLGSNSPAITNTAPYTWLTAIVSDGSTVYIPGWK